MKKQSLLSPLLYIITLIIHLSSCAELNDATYVSTRNDAIKLTDQICQENDLQARKKLIDKINEKLKKLSPPSTTLTRRLNEVKEFITDPLAACLPDDEDRLVVALPKNLPPTDDTPSSPMALLPLQSPPSPNSVAEKGGDAENLTPEHNALVPFNAQEAPIVSPTTQTTTSQGGSAGTPTIANPVHQDGQTEPGSAGKYSFEAEKQEPIAPRKATIPGPTRPRTKPRNPFEEESSTTATSAGSAGQAEADQQAKVDAAQARVSQLEKAARAAIQILTKYDGKKSLAWNEVTQFAQEIDAADKLASSYLVALDDAQENLLDPKNNEESKQFILNKMAFYQKLYDDLTAPGSVAKKDVEEVQVQQENSIIKQLQAILDAANALEQSDPITKTIFNNATKLANKTFVPLLDQMDEDRRKNTLIVVTKLAINSVKKDDDNDNIVKQAKSVIKTIKDLAHHLIKEIQEKNSLQQLQKILADNAKGDTSDLKKLLDESAHYRDLSYEIFKAELIKKDAFEIWNKTYQQITQARQNLNTKNPQSKEYKDAIQQLKKATRTLKKLVDARIDEIAQEKRR